MAHPMPSAVAIWLSFKRCEKIHPLPEKIHPAAREFRERKISEHYVQEVGNNDGRVRKDGNVRCSREIEAHLEFMCSIFYDKINFLW